MAPVKPAGGMQPEDQEQERDGQVADEDRGLARAEPAVDRAVDEVAGDHGKAHRQRRDADLGQGRAVDLGDIGADPEAAHPGGGRVADEHRDQDRPERGHRQQVQ
jgi:hypothetical protein